MTAAPPSFPIANVEISAAEHHADKVTGAQCMACKFVVDRLEKMIGTGATEVLQQSWSLLPVFSVGNSRYPLSCRLFKLSLHLVFQSCYIKLSSIVYLCGLFVSTLNTTAATTNQPTNQPTNK